jgi:hypothetical protein
MLSFILWDEVKKFECRTCNWSFHTIISCKDSFPILIHKNVFDYGIQFLISGLLFCKFNEV